MQLVEALAADHALSELSNYGAIGACLILALAAIVLIDRDRSRIRKRLEEEQQARVDDAKAYLDLALELQRAEVAKIGELKEVSGVLKQALDMQHMDRRRGP